MLANIKVLPIGPRPLRLDHRSEPGSLLVSALRADAPSPFIRRNFSTSARRDASWGSEARVLPMENAFKSCWERPAGLERWLDETRYEL